MTTEKIIIMYDSPEAAEVQSLTGWVSKGTTPNHIQFWGKDEHIARWAGCTHMKCECGHIHEKTWTVCPECQKKKRVERYNAMPFKEWDGVEPVVEWDGDRYFFSLEDLEEYMFDNDMQDIDLLICDPIYYSPIDGDSFAQDTHEDWEPDSELQNKVKEFNDYLKTLPAHSWRGGKVRTCYKLPPEDDK